MRSPRPSLPSLRMTAATSPGSSCSSTAAWRKSDHATEPAENPAFRLRLALTAATLLNAAASGGSHSCPVFIAKPYWSYAVGLPPFDLRVVNPRRGVFQLEAVRFMLEQ
jgi:hypothetical protein